jgi:pilus assembly protein FimV
MDLRMLHGKTALALSIALALPGAAQALGLGEIHLDSALNEPLAANIEIVGATEKDLQGITASIANRETFEHFGVERPEFLSTVAFKISRDSRGRSVLAIRSTDACTELVVSMLVDLRWGGGELIRQYTLLIDPPGFPSPTRVAEAVVRAPASYTAPTVEAVVGAPAGYTAPIIEAPKPAVEAVPTSEKASAAAGEPAARKTVRVGAKATLRGVAWRVGARSDADLNRMMMAIFRANPNAFEGNINRLRLGAVLTIPSATEVSAMSVADAKHEVRAQMQGWHPSTPAAGQTKSVAPALADAVPSGVPSPPAAGSAESAAIAAAPAGAPSARRTAADAAAPAGTALDHRVQELETGLGELRQQLDSEHEALHDALVRVQAQAVTPQAVTPAEKAPTAVRAQASLTPAAKAPVVVAPSPANAGRRIGSIIAAVLALAAAVFGIYAWRRRRAIEAKPSPAQPKMQAIAPVSVQMAPQAAESKAVARSMPVHMEPGAVPVADELFGPDSIATEIKEAPKADYAANSEETVDLEKLEASYLWDGSGGGGFDNTDNFGETASLAIPAKLRSDDPSPETMALETAILAGIPESTTWGLGAPENATPLPKAVADATELDYNLSDLDMTVQHVPMPSAFHENAGFKERRTSLVDALKSAIDREPHRLDLRMKLLETYYAAAATNRQGFLDTVHKIAAERANLNEGEWDKIASMGRQIASEDHLFAPAQPDEEDLANCA